MIPLSFVLGFYVNIVMQRWWNMYCNIPSTDTLSIFVSNSIHGQVITWKNIHNFFIFDVNHAFKKKYIWTHRTTKSNFTNGQVLCYKIAMILFVNKAVQWFDCSVTALYLQDERCRLMRRTIMRYVNLSYVLILSMISTRVKKRFPTLDHLVEAGNNVWCDSTVATSTETDG